MMMKMLRQLLVNSRRAKESLRQRSARKARRHIRSVITLERLGSREVFATSALSIAHSGLTSAAGIFDQIATGLDNLDPQVQGVPLLGEDIDNRLHGLADDARGVRDKLNSVANSLTPDNLESQIQEKLFQVLHEELGILGDGNNSGSITENDVFVHIVDGQNITPSIEVKFDLQRDLLDKPLVQGDFSTGVSSIPLTVSGNGGVDAHVGFDYDNFHFKYDGGGFDFLDQDQNELMLYASAGLTPGTQLEATLGFVKASIADTASIDPAVQPSGLSFQMPVDIQFGNGVPLKPQTPYFVGNLNLTLDAGFTNDLNTFFPGVKTQFVLHREFGTPPASVSSTILTDDAIRGLATPVGGDSDNFAPLIDEVSAAFNNVQIQLGEFFGQVLTPIVEFLQDLTEPVRPLIDVLETDIPVLSDIDALSFLNADGQGGVSLVDVARTVADTNLVEGNYDGLIELVLFVENVIDFVQEIESIEGTSEIILNLGNYSLANTDGGSLLDLIAAKSPSSASEKELVSPKLNFSDFSNYDFASLQESLNESITSFAGEEVADKLTSLLDPLTNGINYSFPIFESPAASIMQVLIGRDAELFVLDGQYRFAPAMLQVDVFELPIGLEAAMKGEVAFDSKFRVGYDTFGLRQALAGSILPEEIADGIFVGSETFMSLDASLAAGLSLDYLIASAGVDGGVTAGIDLAISQPPKSVDGDDGKIRLFSEQEHCLFDASGRLGAFLDAWVSVLGITETFNIANVTLLSFDGCIPNPFHEETPVLGEVDVNGVLTLYVGPNQQLRNVEPQEVNEVFEIIHSSDGAGGQTLVVSGFGRSQTFEGVTAIQADFGSGNDIVKIGAGVTASISIDGGEGDDELTTAGEGIVTLRGGLGNDVLRGGNGPLNLLFGEAGDDTLVGGRANSGTTNIMGISVSDGINDEPGDDTLLGGAGTNQMHGGSGADVLVAGNGSNQMFGGSDDDDLQADHGTASMDGGVGMDSFVVGPECDFASIMGGANDDALRVEGTDLADAMTVTSYNNSLLVGASGLGFPSSRLVIASELETLDLEGCGDADTITITSLSNDHLKFVGVNLLDNIELDGALDKTIVNGRSNSDNITVDSESIVLSKNPQAELGFTGGVTSIVGLPSYKVAVTNIVDDLLVQTHGGNDIVNMQGVTGPTTIDAGQNDDTFNILDKAANKYLGIVKLRSGAGISQVNYALGQTASTEFIEAQDGRIASHWFDPSTEVTTDHQFEYIANGGGNWSGGINITGNNDHNTIFVRSTRAGAITSVNGMAGNDTVIVSSSAANDLGNVDALQGELKVDLGTGSANVLKISDYISSQSQKVIVNNLQILGLAGPTGATPISYKAAGGQMIMELHGSNNASAVESFLIANPGANLIMRGHAGDELIQVDSLSKASQIYGGEGSDSITIGNGSLNAISANLATFGGDGRDTLTMADQLNIAGTYALGQNSVARTGSATALYNDIELLVLKATGNNDTIQIQDQPDATEVVIQGNAGNDKLSAANGSNTFVVSSANGGVWNNQVRFENVENLNGGVGSDRFELLPTGSLTGAISDQGGLADTLDYSARTTSVNVDLQQQSATAAGSVFGIENVMGGNGDDYLAGNMSANQLTGNGGHDILLGREGSDILNGGSGRDLLIGGLHNDTLFGGGDDDILIGARTIYDNSLNSLNQIRAAWIDSTRDYNSRINRLKTGVGANQSIKLNAAALVDDAIKDIMAGEDNQDWFLALTAGPVAWNDQITDKAISEIVN